MPPPKSDGLRARAVALALKLGARGAAEQLKGEVSRSTLSEWLAAERKGRASGKPASAPAPAAARAQKLVQVKRPPKDTLLEDDPPPLAKDRIAQGGKALEDLVEVLEVPDELADVDVDALDFEALEKLDADCEKFRAEARRAADTRQYVQLARLQLEIRAAMKKLRPPPKVDPVADPAHLEARAIVLKRVEKMIANAAGAKADAAAKDAEKEAEKDEA